MVKTLYLPDTARRRQYRYRCLNLLNGISRFLTWLELEKFLVTKVARLERKKASFLIQWSS